MRHALPSFVLFFLTGLTLLAAGCSSVPTPAPTHTAPSGTALTVVGWSLRDQSPVAVRGLLRQGGTQLTFDTSSQPEGKTYVDLAPGRWEVLVTHRVAGSRLVPASGLERIDLRPGETVRCEVVVDDREGAEPLGESSR